MFEAEFVCENVSQTIDKNWICSAADSHPKLMLGRKSQSFKFCFVLLSFKFWLWFKGG